MKKCCVIGSINVDLVISIPRFHSSGETIAGSGFHIFPGGKGANQAVALRRLGQDVAFVGAIGDDGNGEMYRDILRKEHIDDRFVKTVPSETTGVALIEVETSSGNNRIAINAGANAYVNTEYLETIHLDDFDIFLLQLETPQDAVIEVIRRLHALGKTVILDPAPAPEKCFSVETLKCIGCITPNVTELERLTQMPVTNADQIRYAAEHLLQSGAQSVIVKMGAEGAMLVDHSGAHYLNGFSVKVVDTTAAGDSFNAGFAYALALGETPLKAIRFANGVAALSVTQTGAQNAMPTIEQVEQFLKTV